MATTKAPAEPVRAATVIEALEVRYARPEWHVERELTLAGRRLDFVAFNLWGARAYRTVGFEVKVSRADFLRELADFRKTETWTHVVDQFYVVAPGKLIDPSELPAGWGLLELRGSKLFTKAQATIGAGTTLPRELAARMLDRLHRERFEALSKLSSAEARDRWAIREEVKAELRAGLEAETAQRLAALEQTAAEYDALLRTLGVANHWKPAESLVERVRLLNTHNYPQALQRLHEDQERVIRQAQKTQQALAELLASAAQASPSVAQAVR
jgi:hypothetical protein